jgi:hypothetical protein
MKQSYIQPTMKVMPMPSASELLAGSCESNAYWKCPEPEDGCDNPYWCDKGND